MVKKQIEYIFIRNKYRNAIKTVKIYPGPDVNSNHNIRSSDADKIKEICEEKYKTMFTRKSKFEPE